MSNCKKCVYYTIYSHCCGYAWMTGHTRLALHGGKLGINKDCVEFKPKKKGGRRNGVDR